MSTVQREGAAGHAEVFLGGDVLPELGIVVGGGVAGGTGHGVGECGFERRGGAGDGAGAVHVDALADARARVPVDGDVAGEGDRAVGGDVPLAGGGGIVLALLGVVGVGFL